MSYFTMIVLGCFVNAVIFCFLFYFIFKRMIQTNAVYGVTFLFYAMLSYLMSNNSNAGLISFDFSAMDWTRFFLYTSAGALICLGMYIVNRIKTSPSKK